MKKVLEMLNKYSYDKAIVKSMYRHYLKKVMRYLGGTGRIDNNYSNYIEVISLCEKMVKNHSLYNYEQEGWMV